MASFTNAGVGNGIGVTVGGLSADGGQRDELCADAAGGAGGEHHGQGVTVSSGLSANNKVYDGTTSATISSNNVVLAGVVAGMR